MIKMMSSDRMIMMKFILSPKESVMCVATQNTSTENSQSMAIMFTCQLGKKTSSGGLCTVAKIQFVIWFILEAQQMCANGGPALKRPVMMETAQTLAYTNIL